MILIFDIVGFICCVIAFIILSRLPEDYFEKKLGIK